MPDQAEQSPLTVLITAAEEDAEPFVETISGRPVRLIHLPLERYVGVDRKPAEIEASLEDAENIIHGSKRNARFFVTYAEEHGLLATVRDRVNLAGDKKASVYLETHGIPAIYPGSSEPIKMLEFLMRLRRLGTVLYPCGEDTREEIPGLLKELDIEVNEEVLFERKGPESGALESFREQVDREQIDLVIYHSRRSVNRVGAAFPELAAGEARSLAGDRAVADKLKERDLQADYMAEGSWESISELLEDLL